MKRPARQAAALRRSAVRDFTAAVLARRQAMGAARREVLSMRSLRFRPMQVSSEWVYLRFRMGLPGLRFSQMSILRESLSHSEAIRESHRETSRFASHEIRLLQSPGPQAQSGGLPYPPPWPVGAAAVPGIRPAAIPAALQNSLMLFRTLEWRNARLPSARPARSPETAVPARLAPSPAAVTRFDGKRRVFASLAESLPASTPAGKIHPLGPSPRDGRDGRDGRPGYLLRHVFPAPRDRALPGTLALPPAFPVANGAMPRAIPAPLPETVRPLFREGASAPRPMRMAETVLPQHREPGRAWRSPLDAPPRMQTSFRIPQAALPSPGPEVTRNPIGYGSRKAIMPALVPRQAPGKAAAAADGRKRPALAYRRRPAETGSAREEVEVVRREVEETLERRLSEKMETLVSRELRPDSDFGRRLGERLYAGLYEGLVLEKERMGWE